MKWKANFSQFTSAIFLISFYLPIHLMSQSIDTTQSPSHFSGKILATHNGISLVPSFSLDKPAVLFNLSIGKKKLTFEPDIRFALEGKPWSFLFWWRYQAIKKNKYSMRLGAHPAINFRTLPVIYNGKTTEVIESRRFLAVEHSQSLSLAKNIQIGTYYLYSLGLDNSQKNTHFVVLNSAFTNISIAKDVHFHVFPSVYYLKLDDIDGFYFSSSFRLTKKGFPFSLEAIINKKIKTQILPERNFVWNISLVYSFNKQYLETDSF